MEEIKNDELKNDDEDVDLKIFKMDDTSDLYDEDLSNTNDLPKRKKKVNVVTVVLLILVILLLISTGVMGFFAYSGHSKFAQLDKQYQTMLANENTYKQQLEEKDNLIASLNKQLNDSKTVETVTDTYKVVKGPIYFRDKPSTNGNSVKYNNASFAYNGDTFKVTEISTDANNYKWAKIADKVYFCISTNEDVLAKKQ